MKASPFKAGMNGSVNLTTIIVEYSYELAQIYLYIKVYHKYSKSVNNMFLITAIIFIAWKVIIKALSSILNILYSFPLYSYNYHYTLYA
jgi:hypothetical protein